MMKIEEEACCILEICCGGPAQETALTGKIARELRLDDLAAKKVAKWILANYDLAPQGTLSTFKHDLAALARTYPAQPGY